MKPKKKEIKEKEKKMEKLKYTVEKFIKSSDLDEFIMSVYNKPYCFQQQDGCKDEGIEYLYTPSKFTLDDYENTEIPEEINGEEKGIKFSE